MNTIFSDVFTPRSPVQVYRDLSEAIDLTMPRGDGEEVRTVHLSGDRYLCHWWVRDDTDGRAGCSIVIRKRVVQAQIVNDCLVVKEVDERA